MLFGSFLKIASFTLNAGLVFLLMPQEPRLGLDHNQLSIWRRLRSSVFEDLHKVKTDLECSRSPPFRKEGGTGQRQNHASTIPTSGGSGAMSAQENHSTGDRTMPHLPKSVLGLRMARI